MEIHFLTSYPALSIGRMEIIKGPGGSLYGAGNRVVSFSISNDLDNIERGGTV